MPIPMLRSPASAPTRRRSTPSVALASLLALLSVSAPGTAPAAQRPPNLPPAAPHPIDFDREVAPIFDRHCVSCHGTERQRGGYRLDVRELAMQGGNSGPAILPGQGEDSPLVHFVLGFPEDMLMPQKGERLSEAEVGILIAWINQGAPWSASTPDYEDPAKSHWSFQPVPTPTTPSPVPLPPGVPPALQPIDLYIDTTLAQHHLARSSPADPITLVRRMYLVMLGVPPTPEEIAAFVQDSHPNAYQRLVDRVLADTRYGERWGRHWLDIVRFAESNGFETNRERLQAWRFRDYVIDAFNQDKPYDQFIREQLAGDSLGADVATGFLVAGPVDIVLSPDPALTAQQRADQLDDMVATTGTTFLGLTLGCARCHTHKFDPITHREYFAMSAIFAGVRHGERPLTLDPAEENTRQQRTQALQDRLAQVRSDLVDLEPLALPLPPPTADAPHTPPRRSSVQARYNVDRFHPTPARRLRFVIEETAGGGQPGLDELEVYAGTNNVALASAGTQLKVSGTLPGYDIHQAAHVHDGKVGNNHSWISNESGRGWVELLFPQTVIIDRVVWSRDRTGGFGDRTPATYRIEISTTDPDADAGADANAPAWLAVASSQDRLPIGASAEALAALAASLPPDLLARRSQLEADRKTAEQELAQLQERPQVYAGTFVPPDPIHRLHRGDPMDKREIIPPGSLDLFQPLALAEDEPEPQRRLKLADWIARPDHPLTARVLVNRLWQYHFGVGLVSTPNDFGLNGARPSHPELLDALAHEFVASGWSIKHLQRLILLSATWQQSSTPRDDALRVDAGSRYLWRFPPRRLEAEAIRDSLLAVSGVLNPTPGGPSFYLHDVNRENVYHYYPKETFGPAEYRRMIYAFKVRMEQDGIFGAFDCPDGSLVMPKRSVSTTPLQALNLFNSRFTLDLSEAFALRLERDAGLDPSAQVTRAWSLAFNRTPTTSELTDALAFTSTHGLPALARAVLNANELVFIP